MNNLDCFSGLICHIDHIYVQFRLRSREETDEHVKCFVCEFSLVPRNLFDSNHFVEDMSSPLVVPAIPQFSKAVNYVAAQLRILRKQKNKQEIEEKKKMKNNDYKPHDLEALFKEVAYMTALEMKPHIMTIADVNKIVDTALEGMQTLEMKLREKIEEIR